MSVSGRLDWEFMSPQEKARTVLLGTVGTVTLTGLLGALIALIGGASGTRGLAYGATAGGAVALINSAWLLLLRPLFERLTRVD